MSLFAIPSKSVRLATSIQICLNHSKWHIIILFETYSFLIIYHLLRDVSSHYMPWRLHIGWQHSSWALTTLYVVLKNQHFIEVNVWDFIILLLHLLGIIELHFLLVSWNIFLQLKLERKSVREQILISRLISIRTFKILPLLELSPKSNAIVSSWLDNCICYDVGTGSILIIYWW